MWLCSNKIWFLDMEFLISYNFHISQNSTLILIFSPPFKIVKTIPSSRSVQKQEADWIWSMGQNLPVLLRNHLMCSYSPQLHRKPLSLKLYLNLFLVSTESICRVRHISKGSNILEKQHWCFLPSEEITSPSQNRRHLYCLHPLSSLTKFWLSQISQWVFGSECW